MNRRKDGRSKPSPFCWNSLFSLVPVRGAFCYAVAVGLFCCAFDTSSGEKQAACEALSPMPLVALFSAYNSMRRPDSSLSQSRKEELVFSARTFSTDTSYCAEAGRIFASSQWDEASFDRASFESLPLRLRKTTPFISVFLARKVSSISFVGISKMVSSFVSSMRSSSQIFSSPSSEGALMGRCLRALRA